MVEERWFYGGRNQENSEKSCGITANSTIEEVDSILVLVA